MRNFLFAVIVNLVVFSAAGPSNASEESARKFQQYAYSGEFSVGAAELLSIVERNPNDIEAKFGAGALQFFTAVSNLQKELYRYGTGNTLEHQLNTGLRNIIPILRLPVSSNPKPEVASYENVRGILEQI